MKKHLLVLVVCIAMLQLVNAQVIDVVGRGILTDANPTLTIPEMGTVEKVVVEAAAFFVDKTLPLTTPKVITFSSVADKDPSPINTVEEMKAPLLIPYSEGVYTRNGEYLQYRYYKEEFTKEQILNGIISLDKNGQQNKIATFFAYVYRTNGNVNKYSIMSATQDRAFVFRNAGAPVVREFELLSATVPRNIEVAVPLSDGKDIDDRVGVITLFSGAQLTDTKVFNLNLNPNNEWVNFHVERLMLYNVPTNVTHVKVEIYSPDNDSGDSFIVGLPVLTVENIDPGCTRTIGYWKTHSKYGPAKKADATWNLILPTGPDAPFFMSGKTYIQVLGTSPRGNPYYILAHQYIAAELNFLAGAYDGAVDDEFAAAKVLLQTYTPAQVAFLANNNADKKAFTTLGGILDNYNNGIIGPGHCEDVQEKSASISEENELVQPSEFAVYPNPVTNNAIVSFNPANDGLATIELYNAVGQKVARVLHQNVLKGIQVKAAFSGLELNEGLYFMVLQNGNYTETVKVSITR